MQDIIISVCLGLGLAAATGFRVFLPLLIVSLSGYFEVIPLQENWLWISSIEALILLTVASIFEILAYYIPWFDNLLDTIAIPLAAIAGTLVMVSTMTEMSPLFTWGLAIIAGGGTATTVKTTMSGSRLVSTASTAGFANPLLASFETGIASILSILSIFLPILAIIIVILLFIGLRKLYRKLLKRTS